MTRRVAVPVLFLWGLALGLALAGSARAQDATPIPTPTPVSAREIAPAVPLASPAPTPTHPLDGAIERLTLIHSHAAQSPTTRSLIERRAARDRLLPAHVARPAPGDHPQPGRLRQGGRADRHEIVPWVEAGTLPSPRSTGATLAARVTRTSAARTCAT